MAKELLHKLDKRSMCPISLTLELVGDKWSLLIIRDMLFMEKSTYNEFLESPEGISTNILNDRLVRLSELGVISYTGTAKRKKYKLTKLGLDLKPVISEVGKFGRKHFEGSAEFVQNQIRKYNDSLK